MILFIFQWAVFSEVRNEGYNRLSFHFIYLHFSQNYFAPSVRSFSHRFSPILCCNVKTFLHCSKDCLLLYSSGMLCGSFCHCLMRNFFWLFITSESLNRTFCRVEKCSNNNTIHIFYIRLQTAVYSFLWISIIIPMPYPYSGWQACQFEYELWIDLAPRRKRAQTVLCLSRQSTGRLESYKNDVCGIWSSYKGDYDWYYPSGCNSYYSDRRSPSFKGTCTASILGIVV
jgi:hypothetical protein